MLTTAGQQLGPWPLAQMVQAISTGKLGPLDQVTSVQGTARPLADWPELARHLPLSTLTTSTLETDAVKEALVDLDVDTFFGPIDFSAPDDPSGLAGANLPKEMLTIQLDDKGKQVVVAPEEAAEAEMVPFAPWSER